jgi:hypothetical protein
MRFTAGGNESRSTGNPDILCHVGRQRAASSVQERGSSASWPKFLDSRGKLKMGAPFTLKSFTGTDAAVIDALAATDALAS